MKKTKKFISGLLCFILILGIFPSNILAGLKYIKFTSGRVDMQFSDKKATTGTTYKTVGWVLHEYIVTTRNAYGKDPCGVLVGKEFVETDSTTMPDGQILTNFNVSRELVDAEMRRAKLGAQVSGKTVYLDSIFEVYKNGVGQGTYYYTYDSICRAAPWGSQTIEDLKAYFNVPVPYDSADDHPLSKEIWVNGKVVSKEKIGQTKMGVTTNVKLAPTFEYNGATASIKRSFFYYDKEKVLEPPMFEVLASNNKVTDRNPTMYSGGITVVAEYTFNPKLKIEHMDLDTMTMLKETTEDVTSGQTVQRSSESFPGKSYVYSEISDNGGVSWKDRADKTTRNVIVNDNTVIRFYYSSKTDLLALLNLTADPNAIEEKKTATVKFTLDASASKAKSGITRYEFWFSSTPKFEEKPNWIVTEAVKMTSESKVQPATTWYGKVRVTDAKGNTSTAEAQVYIEELKAKPKADIIPNLKLNIIQDTPMINEWHNEYNWGVGKDTGAIQDGIHIWQGLDRYQVDVLVPSDYKDGNGKYKDVKLNFTLDASESKSNNGIGGYKFINNSWSETISDGGSASSPPFEVTLPQSPQDVIDGNFSNKYTDSDIFLSVVLTDSVLTSEKASLDVILQYKYIFEGNPPQVTLDINSHDFGLGETVQFTPGFIENENTYKILNKSWAIYTENEFCLEDKTGEIPAQYVLNLAEGKYKARQYIYYKDRNDNDMSAYAEVQFNVWGMCPPDVTIKSDKEKYIIPSTGIFTTTFSEHPKYSYQIDDKAYKLKNENGTIIAEGKGKFPDTFDFKIEMDSGYYIAEQTIYWWEKGEYKSKTASCRFKLISPKPAGDFVVNMKMSTAPDDWQRIDVEGQTGKEFKQIRIDLTPSIKLNTDLENPYPIDFKNPNTQIQIIPLNGEGQTDPSKNSIIFTPNAGDKAIENLITTIKGKQFIDVRFDDFGTYKIKCRVANQYYTGGWIERNITLREDLPPVVDINMVDVINEGGVNRVYSDTTDLHVRFGVNASATPKDEDTINYDSAKLEVRYDYNTDNDASNDGIHSQMFVTKAAESLQAYAHVEKNNTMDVFKIDMFDSKQHFLGKMRFEYSVAETPKIPNFLGGSMPPVPEIRGTSELVPIEKKIVVADNRAGVINLEVGKKKKIILDIIQISDTPHYSIDDLIDAFGDDITIYLTDKNNNTQLIH